MKAPLFPIWSPAIRERQDEVRSDPLWHCSSRSMGVRVMREEREREGIRGRGLTVVGSGEYGDALAVVLDLVPVLLHLRGKGRDTRRADGQARSHRGSSVTTILSTYHADQP